MLDIQRGEPNIKSKGRSRTLAGLLLILPLLVALASGAQAALPCQDCHGMHHATASEPQQCGDMSTCGTSCHAGKLDTILHPSGAGTPMPDPFTTGGIAAACATCHEPAGAAVSHPYRINTGPSTTSSYPDLNQVCGQCHGGGTDSAGSPPRTGVVYLSKNQLAVAAPNMHSLTSLNNADCTLCHGTGGIPPQAALVNHATGLGTPGTGAAACRTCHLANGSVHRNVPISLQSVCGQCHGGDNGPGGTTSGAPYLTLAQLSAVSRYVHELDNRAPVVSKGTVTVGATSPYSVDFTDTSTDADGQTLTVTVNWGDATISTGAAGTVFSHTYTRAKTYTIYHNASDGMLSASNGPDTFTVTVPLKYSVSGTTSTGNVYLSLKLNGHTVKSAKSDASGAFSFGTSNIVPGDYTITAYKLGVCFSNPAASFTVANANVTDVTINAIACP